MILPRRVAALDTPGLLRLGVLGLAILGIGGTTIELVFLGHWNGLTQQIVWPGVLALTVAFGLVAATVAGREIPRAIAIARILALAVMAIALLGIWFHVKENLGAGPLDRHYADTWDSLGPLTQWWLAVTGQVGPAPTLAPGALLEIALAILLATIRLPATALRRG